MLIFKILLLLYCYAQFDIKYTSFIHSSKIAILLYFLWLTYRYRSVVEINTSNNNKNDIQINKWEYKIIICFISIPVLSLKISFSWKHHININIPTKFREKSIFAKVKLLCIQYFLFSIIFLYIKHIKTIQWLGMSGDRRIKVRRFMLCRKIVMILNSSSFFPFSLGFLFSVCCYSFKITNATVVQ